MNGSNTLYPSDFSPSHTTEQALVHVFISQCITFDRGNVFVFDENRPTSCMQGLSACFRGVWRIRFYRHFQNTKQGVAVVFKIQLFRVEECHPNQPWHRSFPKVFQCIIELINRYKSVSNDIKTKDFTAVWKVVTNPSNGGGITLYEMWKQCMIFGLNIMTIKR